MSGSDQILALHNQYCKLTNRDMPMSLQMRFAWENWALKFTIEDMQLVVRYLNHLIKLDRRRPESFRFYNFVENTQRFSEDLAEARNWHRNKPTQPDRDSVMRVTYRAPSKDKPAMSTEQVMAQHQQMARLLKEYRESL